MTTGCLRWRSRARRAEPETVGLTEAWLLEDIRSRLFAPTFSSSPRAIGVELEFIPVWRDSRERVLATSSGPGTVDVLQRLASSRDWAVQNNDGDPPSWNLSDGARVSFEPGGQIEISSAPHPTATALIAATSELAETVRSAMDEAGIDLLTTGVDPFNPVESVPLQLRRDRYTGMTRYFESLGPSGMQMMRQTAAIQINVERGMDPLRRWRLLNSLAPVVVALFANSARYAGSVTDWASYRSFLWRTLDPSRTGVVMGETDPAIAYLRFALGAGAMRSERDGRYRTFEKWMTASELGEADWAFHLSTLFPEVRPKEYFELRSADTIDLEYLAAPVVFVSALVYDAESSASAQQILPEPDVDALERAGKRGLAAPQMRSLAARLVEIALAGAERMGEDYLPAQDIAVARKYFDERLGTD